MRNSTLKASRAYIAGLGTTGVLIGIVLPAADRRQHAGRVPGRPGRGEQRRPVEHRAAPAAASAAAQRAGGLLAASNWSATATAGPRPSGASGDVFGGLRRQQQRPGGARSARARSSTRGSARSRPGAPRRTGRRERSRAPATRPPRAGLRHRRGSGRPVDRAGPAPTRVGTEHRHRDRHRRPGPAPARARAAAPTPGTGDRHGHRHRIAAPDRARAPAGHRRHGHRRHGRGRDRDRRRHGRHGRRRHRQAVGDTGAAVGGLLDDVTTAVGGLTGS